MTLSSHDNQPVEYKLRGKSKLIHGVVLCSHAKALIIVANHRSGFDKRIVNGL